MMPTLVCNSAPSPSLAGYGAKLVLLMLCGVAGAGCSGYEHIYDHYGSRRTGGSSVNGVDALAHLFARAGHRVRSWNYLSPTLDEADVIVWFPDDPNAPNADVEFWFYDWLRSTPYGSTPRVLIYVGRDYDAAVLYWEKVANRAPPGMQGEYAHRLSSAQRKQGTGTPVITRDSADEWFTYQSAAKFTPVTSLEGPWAAGIDATQVEIEHRTRMMPFDPREVLLADEQGHPIVSQIDIPGYYDQLQSRLILIENGSFLLNAALVNHEHRKLAAKLVSHVGGQRLDVVFIESDADGPPIRDSDPNPNPPTGLELFRVWPIGVVLCQLAVLGMLFALMRWPIFGVPRSAPASSLTDFGHHIAALGRLLRQTRRRNEAIHAIRVYRNALERRTSSPRVIEGAAAAIELPSPATLTLPPTSDALSPASDAPAYNRPAPPPSHDP